MTETNGPRITTWGEVLASLPALRRSEMVSFGAGPTSMADPCLVSDSMDLEDDDEVPAEADERGWRTALLKEQIEDVVENLRKQVGEPAPELVVRAVAYYVDNDAFLTVS
jgi:hypothetical protein